MVPVLSIVFMAVSLIFAFALPAAVYLVCGKRFEMRVQPLFLGAAGFILFALVLEQLLHQIVLRPDAGGGIALKSQPVLYILYGCFAAGIFEETARFLIFHFIKYRDNKKAVRNLQDGGVRGKARSAGDALSYGIGHGGTEVVLLLGVSMISNIVYSIMINAGKQPALGNASQIAAAVNGLVTTPPYMFLIGSVERIFAMAIQISLSVVVWFAVYAKHRAWLFPAAILLHALADLPAAMMQTGILASVFLVETIVGISAVVMISIAVFVYKRFNGETADEMP